MKLKQKMKLNKKKIKHLSKDVSLLPKILTPNVLGGKNVVCPESDPDLGC